jgi:hypothetical protein
MCINDNFVEKYLNKNVNQEIQSQKWGHNLTEIHYKVTCPLEMHSIFKTEHLFLKS